MSHELAVKESQLQEIATQTNVILQQNINSADKALEFGQTLIGKIEQQGGLNDELDKECNAYLVKVRRTLELMNERRRPITQLFDQIKKHFTAEESKLDPKKSDVYVRLQSYRDAFAEAKAKEREKKEAEAKRKLEAARERSSAVENITIQLNNSFYNYLEKVVDEIYLSFNSVTLDNYFDRAQGIASISGVYPKSVFESFTPKIRTVYLNESEVKEIITEALSDKVFEKFSTEFSEKIEQVKEDCLDKLPGKKEELEEIAKAEKEDAKRAEKLKKEAEARQTAEKERLKKEAAEKEKLANEEAGRKKAEADMGSLFENSKQVEVADESQVRKSLTIHIGHPAAFVQIFQVWFEEEGSKLPVDKLEKKTLGQMKRFCETLASKDGVLIDSPYIKYKEDFKVIAKQ